MSPLPLCPRGVPSLASGGRLVPVVTLRDMASLLCRRSGQRHATVENCKVASQHRAPPREHGTLPGPVLCRPWTPRTRLPGLEGKLQIVDFAQFVVHLEKRLDDVLDLE